MIFKNLDLFCLQADLYIVCSLSVSKYKKILPDLIILVTIQRKYCNSVVLGCCSTEQSWECHSF